MIEINNVLKPCLVCTGPVEDKDAYICKKCWDDFKGITNEDEYEDISVKVVDDNNDIDYDVMAEMLEDKANDISVSADNEEPSFHVSKE